MQLTAICLDWTALICFFFYSIFVSVISVDVAGAAGAAGQPGRGARGAQSNRDR